MKNGTRTKSPFPLSHGPWLFTEKTYDLFVPQSENMCEKGKGLFVLVPFFHATERCLKHHKRLLSCLTKVIDVSTLFKPRYFVTALLVKWSLPVQIPFIKEMSSIAMSPVYE